MYTVYVKGGFDSQVIRFKSWEEANIYGCEVFGPGNFEIEMEQCTRKQHKHCAYYPIDF